MSNVLDFNKASLHKIGQYIQGLDQGMARNAWHIAEALYEAKEICETEGTRWVDFLDEEVGYSRRQADTYVMIYTNLGQRGAQLVQKGCSIKTLQALSAPKVPPAVKKKAIDKLVKKASISREDGTRVQEEIRQALPPKAVPFVSTRSRPDFATRLAYAIEQGNIKARYLFDLTPDHNPETASILIKYWKQKYHPDKGGNNTDFAMIVEMATKLENEA